MRHRKFIVLTIIALALLITGAKAKADDLLKSDKITQAIRLYQGNLIFPPPFWVRQVKDIANTKSFQKQQGNLFTLEQIPKEQEFDSWTNLYGVYGYYLPERTTLLVRVKNRDSYANSSRNIPHCITLQFAQFPALVSYGTIMIAGYRAISTEKHSTVIRQATSSQRLFEFGGVSFPVKRTFEK
jgi:hypothetical protein